jgi:hypothetical protein
VERGKHSELIQQAGLYREIYELQLRDQETFRDDMQALDTVSREKIPARTSSGGIE